MNPVTKSVINEAFRIVSKDVREPKCVRDGTIKRIIPLSSTTTQEDNKTNK